MSKQVKVFEPQMCCSSGMCGPTIDENLVKFNELIEKLGKEGHTVERFMLSENIAEFQKESQIMDILQNEMLEALPITMINGKVVKKGFYPTYDEIISLV